MSRLFSLFWTRKIIKFLK